MKHRIRKSSTDSVNSVTKVQYLDVELKNTSKLLMIPNIVDVVDAYKVFESERENCENYRLILTINPFCTNVLFNPMTEIIYKEGSSDVEVIYDGDRNNTVTAENTGDCYGISRPTRQQMIMDSEYSKDDIGYEYHPGFDFFNNHILRNKSFKVVNAITDITDIADTGVDIKDVFNTISDYMRHSDGSTIQITPRTSISDSLDGKIDKHLYNYDDIMSFEDSINNNLSEDNGWFGFTNTSTIIATEKTSDSDDVDTDGRLKWYDMDISRAINNKNACEFVDMYPDRTLFSFNPKINEHRKRTEYNWDIILTYPYKSICEHDIVYDKANNVVGLKIMYIEKTINSAGADTLVFRTYSKHGLTKKDYFNLYVIKKDDCDNAFSDLNTVTKIEEIKVLATGNMSTTSDNDYGHFFYVNDIKLLEDVLGYELDTDSTSENYGKWYSSKDNDDSNDSNSTYYTDKEITQILFDNFEFRFRRVVSDIESKYYIRVFKKLPNLKKRKQNLTEEIANGYDATQTFEEYLTNNATNSSTGIMYDFDREQYKLAFAKTIYNDDSTQVTFTDNIDITYLTDNLGRPLTEIYATILKANRGHEEWYENGTPGDGTVEFSHCFGKVSSGFDFSLIKADKVNNNNILSIKAQIGDIKLQTQLDSTCYFYEDNITNVGLDYDGTTVYNEFIGDIVEFCPSNVTEYVLEPVCHRFNTAQRELETNNNAYTLMQYDELISDDYDNDGFNVSTTNCDEENGTVSFQRKEGYYFNPHYSVQLKEFGNINQDGHYDIKVKTAKPSQLDGIYITITTKLKHNLSTVDIVYVCLDDADRTVEKTTVDNGGCNISEIKEWSAGVTYEVDDYVLYGSSYFRCTEEHTSTSDDCSTYDCFDYNCFTLVEADTEEYEGDYENDLWYKFVASYIGDEYTFSMKPYNQTWEEFTKQINEDTGSSYNWINLSLAIMSDDDANKIYLRRRNGGIPDYATKVDHNTFLWRGIIKPGDDYSTLTDYPFTNNAFYVNKEINFFLKRQDPFGYNGLYTGDIFPSDVSGNKYSDDTYVYTSEDEIVC